MGKRYSFSGNFTPTFDEIARKSSRSGENSSMKENKLTIPFYQLMEEPLVWWKFDCAGVSLAIRGGSIPDMTVVPLNNRLTDD